MAQVPTIETFIEWLRDYEWSDRLSEAMLADLAEYLLRAEGVRQTAATKNAAVPYEDMPEEQQERLAVQGVLDGLKSNSLLNPAVQTLVSGLRTLGLTDIPGLTETEAALKARARVESRAQARAQFYELATLTGSLGVDTTAEDLDRLVEVFKSTYREFEGQEDVPPEQQRSFEDMAREVLVTGFDVGFPQSLEEQQARQNARQERLLALETGVSVAQRRSQESLRVDEFGEPLPTEEPPPVSEGPEQILVPERARVATEKQQAAELAAKEAALTPEQRQAKNAEEYERALTKAGAEVTAEFAAQEPPSPERNTFLEFLQSRQADLQNAFMERQLEAVRLSPRNIPLEQSPSSFAEFLRREAAGIFQQRQRERRPPAERPPIEQPLQTAKKPDLIFRSR